MSHPLRTQLVSLSKLVLVSECSLLLNAVPKLSLSPSTAETAKREEPTLGIVYLLSWLALS